MRKLSASAVAQLLTKRGLHQFCYKPFPGKNPVRLKVEVSIANGKHSFVRYYYHGKWCYEAIRAAKRVVNALGKDAHVGVSVIEYCQTGALYNGDLVSGNTSPHRFIAFPSSRENFQAPRNALWLPYSPEPMESIQLARKTFCLVPVKEQDLPNRKTKYQAFLKRIVGGF